MDSPALYDNILAFDIDGGPSPLSFAKRLARENAWPVGYADRVILEYKRFAFLTMTAGHVCTPSEQVDQAWHLHLCYTHSYWTRFVGEVLPRPLHHNPTKGGKAENAKHDDLYKRTLESYTRAFGEAPPTDVWPPADKRFGEDLAWKRINTSQNWVIPKARIRTGFKATAAVLLAGAVVAGCVPLFSQVEDNTGSNGLIIFVLIAVFGVVGLIAFIAWLARRATPGSSGCTDDDTVGIVTDGGMGSGCNTAGCSGSAPVDAGAGHSSDSGHGGGHDGGGHGGDSSSGDSGSGGGDSGGGGGGDGGGGGCGGGGCGGGD